MSEQVSVACRFGVRPRLRSQEELGLLAGPCLSSSPAGFRGITWSPSLRDFKLNSQREASVHSSSLCVFLSQV